MNSQANKIRVGVIAGAGYTGGELVRLLLNHENAEIAFVQSRSQAGKPLHAVHTDLLGETNLSFVGEADLQDPKLDAIFMALPYGEAKAFLEKNKLPSRIRVIDLSHDFRLDGKSVVGERKFVYGLPEVRREEIKKAHDIANPGCFATAIQLALLPLAKAKQLGEVSVTGVTGSTGAGQKLSETSQFSYRVNNLSAYKTLTHQHVAEIEQTLHFLQGDHKAKVSFIPWRGDFTRGIFVSALVSSSLTQEKAQDLYRNYYEGHPFVSVSNDVISMKSVVNTNRAQIEIHADGSKLAIHVVIDNLLKGASGQAIQNLNLMYGFPENMGLKLKGVVF